MTPARNGAPVRLVPLPAALVAACRRAQAKASFTVLCPARLPRATRGLTPRRDAGASRLCRPGATCWTSATAAWRGPRARCRSGSTRPSASCISSSAARSLACRTTRARRRSGGRRGRLAPATRNGAFDRRRIRQPRALRLARARHPLCRHAAHVRGGRHGTAARSPAARAAPGRRAARAASAAARAAIFTRPSALAAGRGAGSGHDGERDVRQAQPAAGRPADAARTRTTWRGRDRRARRRRSRGRVDARLDVRGQRPRGVGAAGASDRSGRLRDRRPSAARGTAGRRPGHRRRRRVGEREPVSLERRHAPRDGDRLADRPFERARFRAYARAGRRRRSSSPRGPRGRSAPGCRGYRASTLAPPGSPTRCESATIPPAWPPRAERSG